MAIVALVIFRDELRARLRRDWPAGVPVLSDAAIMIAPYLTAERDLGRIAADADVDRLAPMLIVSATTRRASRRDVRAAVVDLSCRRSCSR